MRKLLLLGAVALSAAQCAGSMSADAAGKPAQNTSSSRGTELAARMERALLRQTHIQVTGVLRQGALPPALIRFRYQAPDRESVVSSGGLLARVHVANHGLRQDRKISIGKSVYRSIDGQHWTHGARASSPSPHDAMALNAAGLTCCTVPAAGSGVTVRYGGVTSTGAARAYVLYFRAVGAGSLVSTTVTVSASSYLPVGYTSTSSPPVASSTVRFDYTSPFTVTQPRF